MSDKFRLRLSDGLGEKVGCCANPGDVAQVLVYREPIGTDGAKVQAAPRTSTAVAGEIVVEHTNTGAGADGLDLPDRARSAPPSSASRAETRPA